MRARLLLTLTLVLITAGCLTGAVGGPMTTPSLTPAAPTVNLWTADRFSSGAVRGFNSPGDVSNASMTAMAATGANLVRVFVDPARSGSTYTADLTAVDAVIAAGTARGFHVVITFDVQPNQTAQEYWNNTAYQDAIIALWLVVAARYKGNPTVAGYDLINEPIAPDQATWTAFATRLITAIRAVDPDHVIIHEPSPGALPSAFADAVKLPFTNIVYSVHDYLPYEISHQGLYGNTDSISFPAPASSPLGTVVDASWMSAQLAPVRAFVTANQVPIYVGEFSCVRWAPGTTADSYVAAAITLWEQEGWSWTYHSWREYQGWDAEMPASFFQSYPYTNAYPAGWENLNTATSRINTTPAMVSLKAAFTSNN